MIEKQYIDGNGMDVYHLIVYIKLCCNLQSHIAMPAHSCQLTLCCLADVAFTALGILPYVSRNVIVLQEKEEKSRECRCNTCNERTAAERVESDGE